jgi:uncharacterized membrane protein
MAGSGTRVVGRAPRGWAHDERGSVLIFTAAALAALVGAVALSVDIGNLSYNKRNLQTIADAAAMDARFALNQGASSCAQAVTLADQSALNNNFDPTASGNSLTVTLGTTNVVSDTVTLGTTKEIIQHDHFVPDPASCTVPGADPAQAAATAVQVQTTGNVAFFFAPGSVTPAATAVWTGGPAETGVSIGTTLASFNTANSALLNPLFSGLLGGSVDLTAVGYQGLAGANVTLGQLAAALNIGSVSQLLTTQITYGQLLTAEAKALGTGPQGATVTAEIAALNGLVATAAGGSFPTTFSIGQLINVADPGAGSAADISSNVLGLITAGAEIAQGTGANAKAINIPNVDLGLAGLTTTNVSASVIQPPQMAYGPVGTSATTSQVQVALTMTVDVPLVATVTIPLTVTAASGTATIAQITCPGSTPPEFSVDTQALTLNLGTQANPLVIAPLDSLLGNISAYGPIGVGSYGPALLSGNTTPPPYPEQIPGQPTQVVSLSQLQGLTVEGVGLLGGVGGLLAPVVGAVLPALVQPLDTVVVSLVDPILGALGAGIDSGFVGNPGPTICGTTSGFLY